MRTRKMFFVFSMFFVFYGREADGGAAPKFDFIVRVDRSVRPTYPDWVDKVMNPELELTGPVMYDLSKVEPWLHDDQKIGRLVSGQVIYGHLKKTDALASCLNLQDGLAIQQKGFTVFRKLFSDKEVSLWGSVVQSRNGQLFVPTLYEYGAKIVIYWRQLNHRNWRFGHTKLIIPDGWDSNSPALRFKHSSPGHRARGFLFYY